jgi:predicted 3-demethylubiquinone-9 3-methyltransferase (glyoxalase superfamily)
MAISGFTTCLWFDNEAQAAADLYVSIFPDSKITGVDYYQDHPYKPAGSVLTVQFELFGKPFLALNGGPEFPHSEATSFQVFGDTQEEIDYMWNALIADGGQESQCGWCKDKFGVSWQVLPKNMSELLGNSDPSRTTPAWQSMMQMTKIVIADLM